MISQVSILGHMPQKWSRGVWPHFLDPSGLGIHGKCEISPFWGSTYSNINSKYAKNNKQKGSLGAYLKCFIRYESSCVDSTLTIIWSTVWGAFWVLKYVSMWTNKEMGLFLRPTLRLATAPTFRDSWIGIQVLNQIIWKMLNLWFIFWLNKCLNWLNLYQYDAEEEARSATLFSGFHCLTHPLASLQEL